VPLWITEGVKKGDALTSRGLCVVSLAGVWNWRSTMGTLGDWEDVALKGRAIVICYDADAVTKPNVLRAMVRLGRWLEAKGTASVLYVIVPGAVDGVTTKGADDYLAAAEPGCRLRHLHRRPAGRDRRRRRAARPVPVVQGARLARLGRPALGRGDRRSGR
jgi:Domain of unknown function (DUF3854)